MFKHILVPLDGSRLAECVLPHVIAISKGYHSRVTLLQVLKHSQKNKEKVNLVTPFDWHVSKIEAQKYLDKIARRLRAAEVEAQCAIADGAAAEGIIKYAHANDIDLIIISSHGKSGLSNWNISGNAMKVIARALLPTMIIRAFEYTDLDLTGKIYKKILIPLDVSQRAECVLPVSASLARQQEAQMTVIHVSPRPQIVKRAPLSEREKYYVDQLTEINYQFASAYIDQLALQYSSDELAFDSKIIIHSQIPIALCEAVEADQPDLVIMNAHGYSGGTKWPYGSVVDRFINYCHAPLLIFQDLIPTEIELTKAEELSKQKKGH